MVRHRSDFLCAPQSLSSNFLETDWGGYFPVESHYPKHAQCARFGDDAVLLSLSGCCCHIPTMQASAGDRTKTLSETPFCDLGGRAPRGPPAFPSWILDGFRDCGGVRGGLRTCTVPNSNTDIDQFCTSTRGLLVLYYCTTVRLYVRLTTVPYY